MSRQIHMCMSVRGALRKSNRELDGWITDDNGQALNGAQAREALMDELAKGHEVVPCCSQEECPEFDYSGGGCPGHELERPVDRPREVQA